MATTAAINVRIVVNDGTRDLIVLPVEGISIADVVGQSGKLETVTINLLPP